MTAQPDGDGIDRFVAALRSRLRWDRVGEALIAGAVAGAATLAAGRAAMGQSVVAASMAIACAVAAGSGWLYRRRHAWTLARAAALAEARLPSLRNHLITALELDAHPERATPAVRERVRKHASRIVGGASMHDVHSRARFSLCLLAAGIVLVGAAVAWRVWPDAGQGAGERATAVSGGLRPAGGIDRVTITIVPPAYTGLATRTSIDPDRIEVLSGSALDLQVTARHQDLTMAVGDSAVTVSRTGETTFRARITVVESALLALAVRADGDRVAGRRLIPIVALPDAAPEVRIERPAADLVLERATGRVQFAVRARDDLALASLTLHYTRATGSGEQYGFLEGELPLAVSRDRPGEWHGELTQPLPALGLQEGDLLVYHARATDRRPGAEPAVSDSYVIEIGRPRTAIAGGFAIPPEEDKAALSLSALIVKTERLHAARQSLAPADLTERAAGLAVEQRMVRSETLFLMGAHGEVADEDAEAEHSHEIQEGRLENRGQADLRQATRLMSAAERSLLLADTGGALTSQRAALAAMQRALSRVRYFLRTLPVRSQIDPTRRLSGDLTGASTWTQRRNGSPGDDRMARTRQLLGDLSALALARRGDTTAWKAASADAGDLARRLLAIDPASTQLQDAARGLEELADAPATLAEAEWRQRLSQAAQALQQRLGDAPPAVPVPPALESGLLRGAFADALAGPGGRK